MVLDHLEQYYRKAMDRTVIGKKEEKPKMYPEEWWWAERQVSEVLAEHPGELVKTGEKKRICRRRIVSQRPRLC